jgi:hypothetical protein
MTCSQQLQRRHGHHWAPWVHAGHERGARHTAVVVSDSRLATLRLKARCGAGSLAPWGDVLSIGPPPPPPACSVPRRIGCITPMHAPQTSMPRNTMIVCAWHSHDEMPHLAPASRTSRCGTCNPIPRTSSIPLILLTIRPRPLQCPERSRKVAFRFENFPSACGVTDKACYGFVQSSPLDISRASSSPHGVLAII